LASACARGEGHDPDQERLPATLELAFRRCGTRHRGPNSDGVYTALRRDSWFSHFLLAVSLVGISLPTFLIGILLILVFAFNSVCCLRYAAATRSASAVVDRSADWGGWKHLILLP